MSDVEERLASISESAQSICSAVDEVRELVEGASDAIEFLDNIVSSTGVECADEAAGWVGFGQEVTSGTGCDDYNEIVTSYNDYNELLRDLEVCDASDIRSLAEYKKAASRHGCYDADDAEERLHFAGEVIDIFQEYGEGGVHDADGVRDALHRLTTKSSADSEVLTSVRLLIGALQNAGVLGGTVSVPTEVDTGTPPASADSNNGASANS